MKIPKTFVPDNNLENKVEDLLISAKPIKNAEEQDYKNRKIFIYSTYYEELLDNNIYVIVKQPKGKKGYSLNIKSLQKFFHPISGSNTVPELLGHKSVKTYVRSQGVFHDYLSSLRWLNDSELIWGEAKLIKKLKKNYEAWQSFTKYVMCDENP